MTYPPACRISCNGTQIDRVTPRTLQRLNNKITVTGFDSISTADLDPICFRHGKTYVAEISSAEEKAKVESKVGIQRHTPS